MKTHRCHRAPANQTGLRQRMLAALLGAEPRLDSRRLLCEQLERRYALHGMDWWGESTERYEYAATVVVEDTDSGFSQIRTLEVTNRSARPEPKFLDGFGIGDDSDFETVSDESQCNHSHGMNPEGEDGPGSFFDHGLMRGPIGSAKFPAALDTAKDSLKDDAFSKPQANIGEVFQPKLDLGKFDPPTSIATSNTTTSTLPISAKDTTAPLHPAAAQNSTRSSESTAVLYVPLRAIDFTNYSRGVNLETNIASSAGTASTAGVARSIPNSSPTSALASRADSSPALGGLKSEAATIASQVSPGGRTNLSTTDLSWANGIGEDDGRSASPGNSWQRSLPGTASEYASTSENKAEGLLSELRSVIEKVANDRVAEKAATDANRRHHSSLDTRNVDEFFGSNRRHQLFDDGMLELAATTERLSVRVDSAESTNHVLNDSQPRTQLIASLELNREFELAGQSVDSIKSLVDPTARNHDTILAAKDFGNWNDDFRSTADLSVKPVDVESSLWQRSILPLSFLAIGSLLARSRKKYNARRARE